MPSRRLACALALLLAACAPAKTDTDTDGSTGSASGSSSEGTLGMSSAPPPPTSTEPGGSTGAGTTDVPTGPLDPSTTTTLSTSDSTSTSDDPSLPIPDFDDGFDGDIPVDDPSGTYLLALSTVIQPDLPFQFIATVDASQPPVWRLVLQPLTLDQGRVTTPRAPFGEPLQVMPFDVVGGAFAVDLGVVDLPGPTNPITGSDVVAEVQLAGTVVDDDFFCGDVTGMVTAPLVASIDGSTFAAVRLPAPDVLPLAVTINCAGDTRTDP